MIVPCEPPYSPMRKQVLFLLTAALIISACSIKSPSTESIQKPSLDWVAIADKIVLQSKLQPGERVILVSLPGEFNALVPLLETKISDAGALYLGTISVDSLVWPEEWKTDFVKATIGKSQSDLVDHFGDVDLGIMLPGASPAHVPYAALQEVLNLGKGRTIHFHWSGAYDLSGQVMGISDMVSLFYTKALVETDYEGLSKIQQDFEKAVGSFEQHSRLGFLFELGKKLIALFGFARRKAPNVIGRQVPAQRCRASPRGGGGQGANLNVFFAGPLQYF